MPRAARSISHSPFFFFFSFLFFSFGPKIHVQMLTMSFTLHSDGVHRQPFDNIQLSTTIHGYVDHAVRIAAMLIRHVNAIKQSLPPLPMELNLTKNQISCTIKLCTILRKKYNGCQWVPTDADLHKSGIDEHKDNEYTAYDDEDEYSEDDNNDYNSDSGEDYSDSSKDDSDSGEDDSDTNDSDSNTNDGNSNEDDRGGSAPEDPRILLPRTKKQEEDINQEVQQRAFKLLQTLFFSTHPLIEKEKSKDPILVYIIANNINPSDGNFSPPNSITPRIAGLQWALKPIGIGTIHDSVQSFNPLDNRDSEIPIHTLVLLSIQAYQVLTDLLYRAGMKFINRWVDEGTPSPYNVIRDVMRIATRFGMSQKKVTQLFHVPRRHHILHLWRILQAFRIQGWL